MKRFISFILIIFFMMSFSGVVVAMQTQKRWKNPKHIDTYIQPGYERSAMMKRAFREWSSLTNNKVLFYYVDSPDNAQVEVKFVRTVEGPDGAAGLTKVLYSQSRNEMLHAVILIPTHTVAGREMSRDEVYTSMLHEIGHAIGIVRHSTNPKNIMYPQIDEEREISKYDLAELHRIYGWYFNP